MNIFDFEIRFKFIKDVFVGFRFNQFEILFDASDESLDLADFCY